MGTDNDFESVFDEVFNSDTGEETDIGINIGDADVIPPDDEVVLDDSDDGLSDDEDDADIEEPDDASGDPEMFDWTDHKDKLVEVKVNGTIESVPLGEMVNGYLRQADYTQKTQRIAADQKYVDWSKSLKTALEADPANVIQTLADAYGVQFGSSEDDFEDVDPEVRKVLERTERAETELRRVQSQMAQIEQERTLNAVKAEVADVQSRFADFDPQTVLKIALDEGVGIEKAYYIWKGSNVTVSAKADSDAAFKAAERAALEATKRKNARKVARGNGLSAKPGVKVESFDTFEDMFNAELSNR